MGDGNNSARFTLLRDFRGRDERRLGGRSDYMYIYTENLKLNPNKLHQCPSSHLHRTDLL